MKGKIIKWKDTVRQMTKGTKTEGWVGAQFLFVCNIENL